MPKTRTFDLNYFNLVIGGIVPESFVDGTAAKFTPDGEDWAFVNGADGATGRNRTNIKSGILEITLLQQSPTNTQLSGLRTADLTTPGGAMFPVAIKDVIGQTALSSDECCIIALPEEEWGNGEPASRVWQIKMTNIDMDNAVVGGNEVE